MYDVINIGVYLKTLNPANRRKICLHLLKKKKKKKKRGGEEEKNQLASL